MCIRDRPLTPHRGGRGDFKYKEVQSNRAFPTFLVKPSKKWQQNAQFVSLFREVLTERRRWFEFKSNGEVVEVDWENVKPVGIKNIKAGKGIDFVKRINDLYENYGFEAMAYEVLPQYLQSFKLPIFNKKFRVMSIKDYAKYRMRKQGRSTTIEGGPATYSSLRMDCRSGQTPKEKKDPKREKIILNLLGPEDKPRVYSESVASDFKRAKKETKAETFFTRYEKGKKFSIPDYSTKTYAQTARQ
eukprot:TRINITY_DN8560_c0_g1_i1.p1 TRINITY_DN8560_c0_g1~~TRINITY_DN8560_c0_g1_i1.p1  ORF type:complete len:244 (-),score=68.66 TRINITY_DN8560_c0_g1_i1:284-1015(-)